MVGVVIAVIDPIVPPLTGAVHGRLAWVPGGTRLRTWGVGVMGCWGDGVLGCWGVGVLG